MSQNPTPSAPKNLILAPEPEPTPPAPAVALKPPTSQQELAHCRKRRTGRNTRDRLQTTPMMHFLC